MVRVEVSESEADQRLDVILSRAVPGLSRDRVRALCSAGAVRVDGRRVRKSERLKAGMTITVDVTPPNPGFAAIADPALDLSVLLESERFVVVEKPAGMPSHPLTEGEVGTLSNALLARYPEMAGVGYSPREPGIVHRLDTGTSGLLLAARDVEAFDALRAQLRAGAIHKLYRARCMGHVPAPFVIDHPIARDPRDRRRVRACTDPREAKRLGAQAARTEVLRSFHRGDESRIDVRADRARRHQIRVHLAAVGHPLVGDVLYGAPPDPAARHHQLHATVVRFADPTTGVPIEVSSDAPF